MKLTGNSLSVKSWGLGPALFYTLLSDTKVSTTGKVLSEYTESSLKRVFDVPLPEIRRELVKLEELGYIKLQGITVILGVDKELYVNSDDEGEQFERYDDMLKLMKELQKVRIRGVDTEVYYGAFKKLCELPALDSKAAIRFYRMIFLGLFEEMPTEFTAKEVGQMGHMVKIYGGGNRLKNLIVQYITNYEKYTKDYASIGGLLAFRHKVEADLKTKSKRVIKKGQMDEF